MIILINFDGIFSFDAVSRINGSGNMKKDFFRVPVILAYFFVFMDLRIFEFFWDDTPVHLSFLDPLGRRDAGYNNNRSVAIWSKNCRTSVCELLKFYKRNRVYTLDWHKRPNEIFAKN